jgi:hypothetical protein
MGMSRMRWMAAALAGLALAACGTQQATTSSAAQPASPAAASRPATPVKVGSALCSSVSSVTKLVVTRVTALPKNHLHFALPAGVTVTDPAARDVARAVCALPSTPHGLVMNCPMDLGVSYRLSFAAGQVAFPVVTISAGGCAQVVGAGPVRQATSAGFWTALAQAMGVRHPSSSALLGTS